MLQQHKSPVIMEDEVRANLVRIQAAPGSSRNAAPNEGFPGLAKDTEDPILLDVWNGTDVHMHLHNLLTVNRLGEIKGNSFRILDDVLGENEDCTWRHSIWG